MSAEKILQEEQNLTTITTPVTSEVKFNGHVDINDLLARVRKEKNKENKENFIFFGLISALVLVVGIILSF